MALCGAGFGFFQSPNNRTIVTAAPRARSGAAGGMLATARLLGQTSGAVAVAAGFHWMGVGSGPLLLRGRGCGRAGSGDQHAAPSRDCLKQLQKIAVTTISSPTSEVTHTSDRITGMPTT